MERVADFLGIEPDYFLKYALAQTRESFDQQVVGFEHAVENHEALSVRLGSLSFGSRASDSST